ncbi:uncharacterized protein NPIL_175441 [Nephila pilipes]|uniref:Uncharacterized protein n=1 Tax=Nephila pilipes TaxID=299642 RepID=A0A8X6UK21_NEPPI|nr:uncharacterized protein NPIL_175441 [Nephila pilipes]
MQSTAFVNTFTPNEKAQKRESERSKLFVSRSYYKGKEKSKWQISRTIMSGIRRVMKDYGVWMVGISSIIVIHWAWFRLQQNELFVPREYRFNNPLVQKMEQFSNSVKGLFSNESKKTTSEE